MTLLSFAFGAGILSTVNPCGFAMLPAFLAFYLGDQQTTTGWRSGRAANGLAVGAAVSAGFAGVFIVAGLAVSAGLRSLVGYVPWVAVVIGVVLVGVGIAMVAGRHVGLRLDAGFRPGAERTWGRVVAYGAAYAIASLSCTLAVLLAVVAQALASHNPLQMLGVFGAYGAGAATVLTTLSVAAAGAKASLARGLRRLVPLASRVAGAVLVASGAYLVSYWVPALRRGSGRGQAVVSLPDRLSADLSTILSAHRGLLGALALALSVAAAATSPVCNEPAGRRRRSRLLCPRQDRLHGVERMTKVSGDFEPNPTETPRHRHRWLVAAVAIGAVGLAALWASTGHPSSSLQAGSSPGASGSTFVVDTATGSRFTVPAGRPTILLFMTTRGCTDCAVQAQAIDREVQTSGGTFAALGVEMDPAVSRRDLDSFSQVLGGLHYPLAIDRGGSLQHRFQADALSTVIILDAGGHLVWRSVDPTGGDLQAGLRQAAA
jgi:cytochrome c biogenesis protein CcdA